MANNLNFTGWSGTPNRIERYSIKPSVITDFYNLGPIFTLRAPETYEILNYFY
jgi:hypothetical protein